MSDEHSPRDEVLERLLSELPRERTPSPTFTGRVLRDLHRRGLVRERPVSPFRLAAAAVLVFAAGVAAGVGGSVLVARDDAAVTRVSATGDATPVTPRQLNVPDMGQSEAWY